MICLVSLAIESVCMILKIIKLLLMLIQASLFWISTDLKDLDFLVQFFDSTERIDLSELQLSVWGVTLRKKNRIVQSKFITFIQIQSLFLIIIIFVIVWFG